MQARLRIAVLVSSALLSACFSRPRAVVVERSTEPSISRSVPRDSGGAEREYLVARGDTLYGIAFRHDIDFRALARWNDIAAPYTIYPGQRLRLAPESLNSRTPPRSTRPAPTPGSGSVLGPIISRRPPEPPRPATPSPAPPPASSSTAANPVPATTASVTPSASTPKPVPTAPPATAPAPPPGGVRVAQGLVWRWPASGQLISRYVGGDPTRQGINIAGSQGQPVFAAAQGEVVYSGAGLIGYGELVIIKHSDEYLSAYGHNRKRLVAEGQMVAAGQQIAEMGRSGAARDMLHFEIRRNGKPTDPLPLLPKR
jgi:lipoprotein NlpD